MDIADIVVGERLRSLDAERVVSLKASINEIGLKTPITVRIVPEMVIDGVINSEVPLLVAGLHRLRACEELDHVQIDAVIEYGNEIDARLWEIAENLHRAELTVAERSEHIAEWMRLTEERQQPAQLAPPVRKHGHAQQGGGINAATRELGIERTEAQRAVKIAGLAPEAKAEARALHLDDNQSALLKAAKAPSKEEQLRALREHAASRTAARASPRSNEADAPKTPNASAMAAVARDIERTLREWRMRRSEIDAMPLAGRVAHARALLLVLDVKLEDLAPIEGAP